jgi:NADH-quinone oxidoreductase subunit N
MSFTLFFESDIIAIFPEIFLSVAILFLLVFGVIYTQENEAQANSSVSLTATVAWLSILSIILTLFLLINQPFSSIILLKNLLVQDPLTFFIKIIILTSCFSCFLISFQYLKEENIKSFEYHILILLATLGMILIVSSYDLISMYLAIELQSLSLYVLASFKRTTEQSTEAGLKYFILGAFSSGILLFGCSLVYGFTGSTNFGDLTKLLSCLSINELEMSGVSIGLILIIVALLFKLAAAPFHMWAPDVYEGAPTSVTAFFAIVPKIAIMGLLARICFQTFFEFLIEWQDIMILSAGISMLVGSITGLYQDRIKRLLAYSAIGHVGYILIGMASGSILGVQALLLYLVIYIVMSLNMFGIILSLRKLNKESGKSSPIVYLEDLRRLSYSQPLVTIMLTIGLFSMAGIPPLAGFYSKWYIFSSAIDAHLYLLALVGVVTSVIGSVYYIRIIRLMYFDPLPQEAEILTFQSISPESSFLVGITTFLLLIFFIYPSPLFLITHKAAIALCI